MVAFRLIRSCASLTGLVAVALATVPLDACAMRGIDGTYQDDSRTVTMELKSGNASLTMLGRTQRFSYRVRGDAVILREAGRAASDSIVLRRNADGTITAGIFGALARAP